MKKQFETISELVNDTYFKQYVKDNLSELLKKRSNRKEPAPGFRYKRDWYDRMLDSAELNDIYFLKNIELIWKKQSQLNSEVRSIIKYVCDKALEDTLKEYDRLEAAKGISPKDIITGKKKKVLVVK